MIVRMSKVEIVGPKESLLETLSVMRELALFHIEPDLKGFVEKGREPSVSVHAPAEQVISERLVLEDLEKKIDELVSYLPQIRVRESYIIPGEIVGALVEAVRKHLPFCRGEYERRETLRRELAELNRQTIFLDALESLIAGMEGATGFDFIGVTLKNPTALEFIRELLNVLTDGRFEVFTATARDASLVVLITVQKGFAEQIKKLFSDERIPELTFPQSLAELSFPERIMHVRRRITEITTEIEAIDKKLEEFANHWLAIYQRMREWLRERLSLLRAIAIIYETEMCFLIHGWLPSVDLPRLKGRLGARFGGKVVVEEKEILEEDLARVPVVIRNPPYFRSFEIFARLLPLPSYTSFDPTTFIGIFFPVFFGMILGDAGHGLILLVISLIVRKKYREREIVRSLATILLISSFYTILFGLFYGEFFGELGHKLFGLRALIIARHTAVIPMLFFALSVGVFHVVLGLFLGFLSAVRRKGRREALFKLLNILVILCIAGFFVARSVHMPPHVTQVFVITAGLAIPFLVIGGGLLAPLELIKSIGNIISYSRIMAVGLASVLLASVANTLAGMTGNILTGILVAGLFHAVNILLGVFAPTIQSLRLHYVEFFSKFLEYGGRKFEPFK